MNFADDDIDPVRSGRIFEIPTNILRSPIPIIYSKHNGFRQPYDPLKNNFPRITKPTPFIPMPMMAPAWSRPLQMNTKDLGQLDPNTLQQRFDEYYRNSPVPKVLQKMKMNLLPQSTTQCEKQVTHQQNQVVHTTNNSIEDSFEQQDIHQSEQSVVPNQQSVNYEPSDDLEKSKDTSDIDLRKNSSPEKNKSDSLTPDYCLSLKDLNFDDSENLVDEFAENGETDNINNSEQSTGIVNVPETPPTQDGQQEGDDGISPLIPESQSPQQTLNDKSITKQGENLKSSSDKKEENYKHSDTNDPFESEIIKSQEVSSCYKPENIRLYLNISDDEKSESENATQKEIKFLDENNNITSSIENHSNEELVIQEEELAKNKLQTSSIEEESQTTPKSPSLSLDYTPEDLLSTNDTQSLEKSNEIISEVISLEKDSYEYPLNFENIHTTTQSNNTTDSEDSDDSIKVLRLKKRKRRVTPKKTKRKKRSQRSNTITTPKFVRETPEILKPKIVAKVNISQYQTRSGRLSVRPLKFWCNERIKKRNGTVSIVRKTTDTTPKSCRKFPGQYYDSLDFDGEYIQDVQNSSDSSFD